MKEDILKFLLDSSQGETPGPNDELQTWLGDEDLYMGDYILVFKNPDVGDLPDNELDVEDALLKYDRFFAVESESYYEAIL